MSEITDLKGLRISDGTRFLIVMVLCFQITSIGLLIALISLVR